MSTVVKELRETPLSEPQQTRLSLRPRFEGSNICTWIGFKHVMYLVEEAILEHFRKAGFVPRELFEQHGLCFEVVDSKARILHALHMDDLVDAEVMPVTKAGDSELRYHVVIYVARGEERLKAVAAKVYVLFKLDDSPVTALQKPHPVPALASFTVEKIARPEQRKDIAPAALNVDRGLVAPEDEAVRQLLPKNANAFVWKWHIPYFYCHFTERMQHSGYLRLMEEVEDLFLADRGVSIRTMLHTKKWIPVVPEARVEILEEAYMEEVIYTVYTVEDVFKEFTYTNRMDCYVLRDGRLVKTATGRITHGYAVIDSRRNWSLVGMDADTVAALKNEPR